MPISLSTSPAGIPQTVLDPEPADALARLADALAQPERRRGATRSPAVVARWPRFLDGWARLGELARDDVEAYACFRVGYHRGLDRLRQSGWRGSGYVRWEHETNRGFLRALDGLACRAAAIGEADEEARCDEFLHQLEPGWDRTRPRPTRTVMKRALITGITGQDGRFLAAVPRGQGLPGVRPHPRARTTRRPRWSSTRRRRSSWSTATCATSRRSSPRSSRSSPTRSTTSARSASCSCRSRSPSSPSEITGLGVLRMLEAVRIVGGAEQQPDPLLPGVVVGDVRQGARDAAERAHAVPPAVAVRRRQGVRPPHDGQLPRVVRAARVVGHPVQPREPSGAGSSSSPARSPTRSRASSSASRTRSRSATSTPRATGGTPATTSRRCGSCSSRTSPTTTSSPPARPTPSASSSTSRSASPATTTGRRSCSRTPRFERPAEVDLLMGDATKAREKLGWTPKVTFEELVQDDVRVRPRRGDRPRRIRPVTS